MHFASESMRHIMKQLILLIACTCTLTHVAGQTTLSGRITDARNLPLPMANVSIEGSYDGASTDRDGTFEFTTSERGRKILVVSYTGFHVHSQEIVLDAANLSFTIMLKENVQTLEAVTINAGSFTAGDGSAGTVLRALDIATTAGATADIAGALNTLPGTQRVGESGRLFIRGGDANETQTYIDGMLVPDAYSPAAPNAPSRGRFLPFMFKGITFSTGGYSAEYGQALSSTLILDSKDQAAMSRTDLGLLSVGGDAGHTHVWNKGSMGGKLEYTNLRPYFGLMKQEIDWKEPPLSIGGHAALRQKSGKNGLLKLYGNYGSTRFSLINQKINGRKSAPFHLDNHFRYVNGFYKNNLNERWIVRGGFSLTGNRTATSTDSVDNHQHEKTSHGKIVFEGGLSDKIDLKTGAEIIGRGYFEKTSGYPHRFFHRTLTSVFAEANYYITNRLTSRSGFRVEHNTLNKRVGIDPRFSIAYKTGSYSQVSFASGRFRQSPNDKLTALYSKDMEDEKAVHYILNYQHSQDNRTFRVETYYKRYKNLIKLTNNEAQPADNNGYGFARGVELFWRDSRTVENIDYWISYSYLDTKRNYLDFPHEAVAPFVSNHNLSIVFKQFIKDLKSQIGITCAYASGRYYRDPNSATFNSLKTPPFHDVSLNWSYLPAPFLIVYASCTNILGRDNIFGYEYSSEKNARGIYESRLIRQPAKHFLFLAVFITLSKEKSVNQLPNL